MLYPRVIQPPQMNEWYCVYFYFFTKFVAPCQIQKHEPELGTRRGQDRPCKSLHISNSFLSPSTPGCAEIAHDASFCNADSAFPSCSDSLVYNHVEMVYFSLKHRKRFSVAQFWAAQPFSEILSYECVQSNYTLRKSSLFSTKCATQLIIFWYEIITISSFSRSISTCVCGALGYSARSRGRYMSMKCVPFDLALFSNATSSARHTRNKISAPRQMSDSFGMLRRCSILYSTSHVYRQGFL